MRPKTQGLMPRAHYARGEVRGALPRIPVRGTPPETPPPFLRKHHLQVADFVGCSSAGELRPALRT